MTMNSNPLLAAFSENKKSNTKPQLDFSEDIDPPLPYLAIGEDKYGQPYYGDGLQGYAKKIFASVFDPSYYLNKPSENQMDFMDEKAKEGGKKINEKLNWDSWIGKWTGVKAEEVARGALAIRMTGMEFDEEGNPVEQTGLEKAKSLVQAGGRLFYKGGTQAIKSTMDALSLADVGSRKGQAVSMAVDDAGDSSIMPDVTIFDESTKFGGFANALTRFLNPTVQIYNQLRMLTNGKSLAENFKAVKNYSQGSGMVYSMYWDQTKKQEYLRRLKAGENPDMLVSELQNPWVELAGSILGDPTTYMGMGIIGDFGKARTALRIPFTQKVIFSVPWRTVSRLPGFTEIFHLNAIGKGRLAASGDFFTKVVPELETTFKGLENAADNRAALTQLKQVVTRTGEQVMMFSKSYGFFSPDSKAKADVMKKTIGTVYRSIAPAFRDGDDIGEFVKAARNITSKDPKLAAEAFSTLKKYGPVPFSEGGMRAINYLSKLDTELDIATLVEKHGDNLPELAKVVEDKLFKVVEETFPSVDDMEAAYKAFKAGDKTEKVIQLADEYKKIKSWVKASNRAYKSIADNNIYRGFQSFFASTYMGLSPAYALRNLQNNTFTIWHDLGGRAAGEALEAGIAAAVPFKGDDIAKRIEEAEIGKLKKLLGGVVPTTALKGVGQAGQTGFGALAVGQRIEQVQSAIIVRNVVETELEKMLRYGYMPKAANLPAEHAARLEQLTLENYGDVSAAIKQFRREMNAGEFEVFRSLALDSNFKDWLRKINKLDEIEEIRKTAKTADEFVERMEAVTKQLDEFAARAANETAQVSDANPMGEAVVQIERAMANEASLGREEVNQFKALTELYDQMRLQYTNISRALEMQLSRLLPSSEISRFSDKFDKVTTDFNQVVGETRNLATDFYEGSYQLSRKGTPTSELWNTVKATVLDADGNVVRVSLAQSFPDVDPAQLSGPAFRRMAWKWIKDTQGKFWRDYNQSFVLKQDGILEEMATMLGTTLDDMKTQVFQGADNPKLTRLQELFDQIKQWEEYVAPQTFKQFDDVPKGTKLTQMKLTPEDFPGGKTHLFNAVNKERATKGLTTYATMDEVPFEEAVQVIKARAAPMPPHVGTTTPTTARQLYENLNGGGRDAIKQFVETTVKKWGETIPVSSLSPEAEQGISRFAGEVNKHMVTARAKAMAIADETRNFILHDYNKTYGDKFFGMFMQYHYWPSRTYTRWAERLLDTPGTMSAYMKWKDTMDKIHADQPEYYRYNFDPSRMLGMENPMFFNLEATLNPLYGLTGVDYNDPYRRADWASSTVDDLTKFGFNMFTPLQWLMACNLYRKGEDEAARRWMGRLIPATQTVKAGLNMLDEKTGVDLMPEISALPGTQYGEFDPFVNIFQGGMDPNEEKRIGRAIAAMIKEGVPAEQAFDALLNRDGPLYDEAVQRAINERGGGQLASYFLGVGYKNRTKGDLMVDEFYKKYYKLLSVRNQISPESYRNEFDKLKEEFPFADAILLSKRGGDERDGAYAYNVLGRVPPGYSDNLLESVGVSRAMLDKFYNDKGNFSDWSEQDRNRFMAAILDLGAMLKMPDLATKEDWNNARDANKAIYKTVESELGSDIWDKVNAYYDIKDTDPQAAFQFKEANPDITQALSRRQELLMQNPDAFRYFGSIDSVEAYYNGRVRAQLKEEFGDLSTTWQEYYSIKMTNPKAAKAFYKSHPELRSYSQRKAQLELEMNKTFVNVASMLPERDYVQLREDLDALSPEQQTIANALQPQSIPSWDEVKTIAGADISPALETILNAYWQSGEPLSAAAENQLEYLASRYGQQLGVTNGDAFLRLSGLAMNKPAQQEQPGQWANPLTAPFSQP